MPRGSARGANGTPVPAPSEADVYVSVETREAFRCVIPADRLDGSREVYTSRDGRETFLRFTPYDQRWLKRFAIAVV
jgi:hypothetical protein